MMSKAIAVAFGLFLATQATSAAPPTETSIPVSWVSAWSTAVHAPLPFPGLPPTPVFQDQTLRMVVRLTAGGSRVRVRFSNAYGSAPLEIAAAHVALTDKGAAIVPATDRALTFGGKPSATVPVGAPLLSDPVDLPVTPLHELSISLYLPLSSPAVTTHFWGQHATYVSGPGDLCAKPEISASKETDSWYWISDVEVQPEKPIRAVVTFGDSITDGAGAKQGNYEDWPDRLAQRLGGDGTNQAVAVLNEGIGGNRILYDGAGVNALARLDRDVLAQSGVTDLLLLEGINDIGWPDMKPRGAAGGAPQASPFANQRVTADALIVGMRQIIDRAHQHNVRVYGATLTPYEGADYFTPAGEQIRETVNQWIRTGGAFDGVVDFDAAVRDPAHPTRFQDALQSGDHLHPSAAGYQRMADAIDLKLFGITAH